MAQKRSTDGNAGSAGQGRTPSQYPLSADIICEAFAKSGFLVTLHLQKTLLAKDINGAHQGFFALMQSVHAIKLPNGQRPALIWIVEDKDELKAVAIFVQKKARDLFDWMNQYTLIVVIKPSSETEIFIQDDPVKRQALTASSASVSPEPSALEAYVHFAPPNGDWNGGAVCQRLVDRLPSDIEDLIRSSYGVHGSIIRQSGSESDKKNENDLTSGGASFHKLEDLIASQ